jgi:ligand-binding sensor domain-containing protein/anti-sigma regulatory factor (Ser/Thr protein kinase)
MALTVAGKSLYAQTSSAHRLYFNHITTLNGLSGNGITALFRDARGFLWIGTTNGLNEYDGRHVTVFHHNRFDPHSIISNTVYSIAEDDSGYLWLGTNKGVSRLNPFNHQSVNYRHDPDDPLSLSDDHACRVYCDKEGTLWVGNESGLSYYNKSTKGFVPVQILPDSLNKRTLTAAGIFLEDAEGRFWIGTYSGLVLYDRKKHTFRRYILHAGGQKDANPVSALFQDHAGRIWVGFWGSGLCSFDPGRGTFSAYKWNKKSRYKGAANIVFAISETRGKAGKYVLWAGTSEGLLKVVRRPPSDETVIRIGPDPGDLHALSNANISCMIADARNILWIGTKNGLNAYMPENQLFSSIIPLKGTINRIWVDSISRYPRYFIATWYGNGLTELDKNFQPVHRWVHVPPEKRPIDNGQISDVLVSKDGSIWIGTFNGLYRYQDKTGVFTSWLHRNGNQNTAASNHITSLQEDDKGLLWIGTYGQGVDAYDPSKNSFSHYRHQARDTASLSDDLVWNIYKDRRHRIWIATNRGLSLFDQSKDDFINFTDHPDDPNTLKGSGVSGLVDAGDGIYWIATDKGLNRFDRHTGRFTLYAEEEGLADEGITALVTDPRGLLWMCTRSGISSFNPATHSFINYNEQNGLPFGISDQMARGPSGTIIAGGGGMLLRFNPADFKSTYRPPPVYITDIKVNGRTRRFNRAPEQSGPLVLHYPDRNFSVSFSAPQFLNTGAIKYAYRLEGADPEWIPAGNRNFVSYGQLSTGTYVLQIKAAGTGGVWDKSFPSLQVIVLPPFWGTWWFRIAVILLIAFCIYLLFTRRIGNIRRREALQTSINKEMADMRLKILHARMNPHFMFNALNAIQECIYTGETETAVRYLSKFSRLTRMILENSERTFITVSQEIELLQLYLELESLRFQRSFTYHITHQGVETDFLKMPLMVVQPFVENAIWHGLLHKKGDKKLSITFQADDVFIYVTIEDNGVGRDAARRNKLKTIEEQQSLGIRLASEQLETIGRLSRHKAGILVEDLFHKDRSDPDGDQPAGTRVILTLPIMTEEIHKG